MGANTGVGKTLVSAALAHEATAQKVWYRNAAAQFPSAIILLRKMRCLRFQVPFLYVKPIQTGFPEDSDAATVVGRLA